jgi:thioredoxin-like negative regulator of GroEL
MKTLLFTSPTCGPCKQLKTDLEAEGILSDITLVDVSYETSTSLVSFYGVRSVPTLVILDDDEEIIKVRVGYTGSLTDIKEIINGNH